jgi:two-component system, chemotaxis family, response regulator Rcp1
LFFLHRRAELPLFAESERGGVMTQSGNGNLRPVVLHVEDSDAIAYLLRYALREQKADVDVFRLCDGQDAISYLARHGVFAEAPRPDVIVLDLDLPKKNGHDILVEIREEASLQRVPVIVFTSSVRAADREKAIALGAKHYFYKTSDLGTFTAVSQQILDCLYLTV